MTEGLGTRQHLDSGVQRCPLINGEQNGLTVCSIRMEVICCQGYLVGHREHSTGIPLS